MDYQKEAATIREDRPQQVTICPPPRPLVGEVRVLRRQNGGYLVTANADDGQAGQFMDGSLAVEVIAPEEVDRTAPEDLLASALRAAHDNLNRLRLEDMFKLIPVLGEGQDEEALVALLRQALHQTRGDTD